MGQRLPPATTVLVTRPKAQSATLAQLIVDAGGRAVLAPMIQIESTGATLNPSTREAIGDSQAVAVFLSANCVRHAFDARRPPKINARILAMGDATAAALVSLGYPVVATPVGGIDSESLLQHPLMQAPQGRKFIVFQGTGGREIVQKTLISAGAELHTHVCYRRTAPTLSPQEFATMWQADRPDVCVITSATALVNLLALAAERCPDVREARFVVMGQRLAHLAREHGVTGPISVATVASDEGLFAALIDASD